MENLVDSPQLGEERGKNECVPQPAQPRNGQTCRVNVGSVLVVGAQRNNHREREGGSNAQHDQKDGLHRLHDRRPSLAENPRREKQGQRKTEGHEYESHISQFIIQ